MQDSLVKKPNQILGKTRAKDLLIGFRRYQPLEDKSQNDRAQESARENAVPKQIQPGNVEYRQTLVVNGRDYFSAGQRQICSIKT